MKWKPEEVPNLDAMSADELSKLWSEISRSRPGRVARKLFPDRRPPERAGVVESLAAYAISKAAAIRCRMNGKIDQALKYEAACDLHYDDLPEWARW